MLVNEILSFGVHFVTCLIFYVVGKSAGMREARIILERERKEKIERLFSQLKSRIDGTEANH